MTPDEGGDVSRETSLARQGSLATAENAKRALLSQFPDATEGLLAYVQLLSTHGIERGLLGPREAPRLWDRHILNCALVQGLIPVGATVLDIGTGAGLPGVVLALVRPDLNITLLDSLERRTAFLSEACVALELTNTSVLRGRAEEIPPLGVDVATSRAVAPLEKLTGWSVRHVRPGGQVLALKGESAQAELQDAQRHLKRAGVEFAQVVAIPSDVQGVDATQVVRLRIRRR